MILAMQSPWALNENMSLHLDLASRVSVPATQIMGCHAQGCGSLIHNFHMSLPADEISRNHMAYENKL